MRLLALSFAPLLASCIAHEAAPSELPHDARGGIAPEAFDAAQACGAWRASAHGEHAKSHVSFPELDAARACFVPVTYDHEIATPGTIPAGCGYRPSDARAAIEAEADRDERIARAEPAELPLELACKLPDEVRRAAAARNARTLRALSRDDALYAYGAIEIFGYGNVSHVGTAVDGWTPGQACPAGVNLRRFSINVDRAARGSLAWAGHVAPVIVASGGAVHSTLVEAFLLDFIATCRVGVPSDRVLVDPCANHTHTNVRNAGRITRAIGARTSYIVTDDLFQATYLQEWTLFDLFGGSLDQRALRDWGYLLGSWRQASIGIDAGFWYTPYRFWADVRYREFSCVK